MLLTLIFYLAAFYVQYAGRRFGVNLQNAWHAVLNRLCIFGVGLTLNAITMHPICQWCISQHALSPRIQDCLEFRIILISSQHLCTTCNMFKAQGRYFPRGLGSCFGFLQVYGF